MRTLSILSILLFGLFSAGCGGSEESSTSGGGGGGYDDGCGCYAEDEGCGCGGDYTADQGTATVKGVVKWEGTPPPRRPIDMGSEKYCIETHTEPMLSETTIVGSGGGLANVFVHVTEGLDGWKFPTPGDAKVLDQQGCTYVPHVLGIQVGQTLKVRNSDPILHNVHAIDTATKRDAFNFGQSTKGAEAEKSFRRPALLSVKCDVHGWMQSYVHVLKHPFYAVTGEDGAFSLDNLPPGTYTVTAWHERWGTKTAKVTVGDGETQEIDFSFAKS